MADWVRLLLRTAGLRLLVLPISAGLALVTAAITFQTAGVAAFGLITMVAQLQLALPFADLGLGAAVARAVARAEQSPQQRRHADALIRRTALLLASLGAAGIAVVIWAGAAGVFSSMFVLPDELASDFDLVATVVLAMFFLGLPFGLAERILVGQDRASLLVVLGLILSVVNVCVAATVANLGLPPMWLAAGLPIGSVFFLAACTAMALKRWGRIRRDDHYSVSLGTILWGGLPVVLTVAGTVLAEQHGRVVLAQVAPAETVSEYALGLYLYMPVYSVLYMGATILWPRFARNPDPRLWRQANWALLLLGVGAATGYLVFARPLSGLVSDGELVISGPVVACFCLAFIAQSGHLVQENLLTDVRGFRLQAAMSLTLLVLVVPLTVVIFEFSGSAGAPAAALACAVVVAQVIPGRILARRVLAPTDSAASALDNHTGPPADRPAAAELTPEAEETPAPPITAPPISHR